MLGVLLIDLSQRLVKAGIDPLLIKAVCIDLTEYGKQYLNLVKDGYRTNWWKLFNAADPQKQRVGTNRAAVLYPCIK